MKVRSFSWIAIMVAAASFTGMASGEDAAVRSWTSAASGKVIQARFLGSQNGIVKLKLEAGAGREYEIALADLSEDDQNWVRKRMASPIANFNGVRLENWKSDFDYKGTLVKNGRVTGRTGRATGTNYYFDLIVPNTFKGGLDLKRNGKLVAKFHIDPAPYWDVFRILGTARDDLKFTTITGENQTDYEKFCSDMIAALERLENYADNEEVERRPRFPVPPPGVQVKAETKATVTLFDKDLSVTGRWRGQGKNADIDDLFNLDRKVEKLADAVKQPEAKDSGKVVREFRTTLKEVYESIEKAFEKGSDWRLIMSGVDGMMTLEAADGTVVSEITVNPNTRKIR